MRTASASLFLWAVAAQDCDLCACDKDGVVGEDLVDTGRPGCAAHLGADIGAFCYVDIRCPYPGAALSQAYPTARWMDCDADFVYESDACDPDSPTAAPITPCPADGIWAETQPGQSVGPKACPDGQTGERRRTCGSTGAWLPEVSTCVAQPTCTDDKMNGDESGVDCGGSCPECAFCPTVNCGLHGTCDEASKVCKCTDRYIGDRCQTPPATGCDDVDCGDYGTCNGGTCTCLNNWSGTFCTEPPTATCTDGVRNGQETGIDCGSGEMGCPACETESWSLGPWSACSKLCGGGYQSRIVRCLGRDGQPTDNSVCINLHPAPSTRACNVDACAEHAWSVEAWEPCSTECGGGFQIRVVRCRSSLGQFVEDAQCDGGSKPDARQACSTQACTVDQRWVAGEWGTCSRDCGGGEQTRDVECRSAATEQVVEEALCTGTMAAMTRACNLDACTNNRWTPCDWDDCTATCNGGTGMVGWQHRLVLCRDSKGDVVDPSLCKDNNQITTQIAGCNAQLCDGYNWMADGAWGACIDGFQYRTFHCHSGDGRNALYSDCLEQQIDLPPAKRACEVNQCPLKLVDSDLSAAPRAAPPTNLLLAGLAACLVARPGQSMNFLLILTLVLCLGATFADAHVMAKEHHYSPVSKLQLRRLDPSPDHHNATAFGHPTPFGKELHLSFSAFDKDFDLELELMDGLFAEELSVEGKKPALRSYHVKNHVGGVGSVTVQSMDAVFAVIGDSEDVYTISPAEQITGFELQGHAMYAVRQSDIHGKIEKETSIPADDGSARRLLSFTRSLLQVPDAFGTNCYTGRGTGKTLKIGIAADSGYASKVADIMGSVEQIVATSNDIYVRQMNVRLAIGPTKWGSSLAADVNRGSDCGISATQYLDKFRAWRSGQGTTAGVYHLMTDCFPPPGTIGIAYMGVLCNTNYGAGLTTYTADQTWLTFAHEIGHNFAADHSFEFGQGSTGGIMDYGDGLYNGIYQFRKDLRETEICGAIREGLASNYADCFSDGSGAPEPSPTPAPAPTQPPTACPATEEYRNCEMWANAGACTDTITTGMVTFMNANCGRYCCGPSVGGMVAPKPVCSVPGCSQCYGSMCTKCAVAGLSPSDSDGRDCVSTSTIRFSFADLAKHPGVLASAADCHAADSECRDLSQGPSVTATVALGETEYFDIQVWVRLDADAVTGEHTLLSAAGGLRLVLVDGVLQLQVQDFFIGGLDSLPANQWAKISASGFRGNLRVGINDEYARPIPYADEDPTKVNALMGMVLELTVGNFPGTIEGLQVWGLAL